MQLYDVRIRDLLIRRIKIENVREIINACNLSQDVRDLLVLTIQHQMNAGKAISEFMAQRGRSPFLCLPTITTFHKVRDAVFETMLPHAETSPTLMGDHEWHEVTGGFSFLRYDVFMLENENYMVVDAAIVDNLFQDKWKRRPDSRDREMFEKTHVYTLIDGDWVITYDDYAEQYKRAYAMMKNMTSFVV